MEREALLPKKDTIGLIIQYNQANNFFNNLKNGICLYCLMYLMYDVCGMYLRHIFSLGLSSLALWLHAASNENRSRRGGFETGDGS